MRWPTNDSRIAPRRHGIARRVARVAMASAAAGGLLAAVVAVIAVDQLIAEHVDQRLQAATLTLAGELDEEGDIEGDEQGDERPDERAAEGHAKASDARSTLDSVTETLDDENQEIESSGIRLGVFAHGELIAGQRLPLAPAGGCETHGLVGSRLRACARPYGDWLLVAAQPSDASRLRWLYALSALLGIALAALGGAVLSRSLTPWAVGPLTALSGAIARSRPESSLPAELGPDSGCAEVDAIRDELLRLIERTRALLDQSQRFVANAAHELRTPLTTLRAELELHAEEVLGPSREVLDRASLRIARLSDLIERLLVLALPTEKLQERFEPVSIADLIQELVNELPAEASARVRPLLNDEGLVRGDAELLRAVVGNLLNNALKFAPSGPITLSLVTSGSSEPEVRLEVRDTGPGIPRELRRRVFEPFHRLAPNATPGHGVGLALVGHVARAHGGSAEFVEAPVGACLVLRLPGWSAVDEPGSTAPAGSASPLG
jgi:two-component system OmpR family sensor kinase